MANQRFTAKEKIWMTRDRSTLVANGDLKAAVLFAKRGDKFDLAQLSRFDNAEDFFPELVELDEPPKRGPGRPKKPA